MRAALAAVATVPRSDFPRRIAVLGDMLELGQASADLHRGLGAALDAAGIDLLFACGPMMKALFDGVEPQLRGAWAPDSARLEPALLRAVQAGDAVMVKGSLATRMALLVAALNARFSGVGG
jgi:UDP-N-acetylmuramoyl-tripeptide--D-alanyl-D-alanine ligase